MSTTTAQRVAEAKTRIENVAPEDISREIAENSVVVDLREPAELAAEGMIEGAIHAPRGMLEFWADPSSAYHRAEFDPEKRTILYCASGGRSALAAETLRELGYTQLAHLDGGIAAWKAAGHPVVAPSAS
jgi:rhodanese-related sulfurtransferase